LKVKKSWLRSLDLNQQLGRCTESFDPMGQDAASITDPFGCFPKRRRVGCHATVTAVVKKRQKITNKK
jgi:hypothetical protein